MVDEHTLRCPRGHVVENDAQRCSECGFSVPDDSAPASVESQTRPPSPEPSLAISVLAGGAVLGLVVLGLYAWTGSWWGVLAVPVALLVVGAVTALSPEEHQGKIGCLGLIVAILMLGAIFPAMSGKHSSPSDNSDDYSYSDEGEDPTTDYSDVQPSEPQTHDPNDGAIDHEDACNGLEMSAQDQAGTEIGEGLQKYYDENCR